MILNRTLEPFEKCCCFQHQNCSPMRFHILGDALVDVVAGGLVKLPEADGDATAETMTLRAGAFNRIDDGKFH